LNTVKKRVVTFDGEPPPGTIDFGLGQPSSDLLPIDLIRTASMRFFEKARPLELNYGAIEGDARFLSSLASFLTAHYGRPSSSDELLVTGGNSQALDLVSYMLASPGDTIFVEEPSFFLAFQIFRDHALNIVSIPVDEEGLCIDALMRALKDHKPSFLYTIPAYHNPVGHCTSEERRKQIVELAETYGFFIVADEVYQLLSYYEAPPPAYATMTESDRVVSLGSFSKILAPGMRLGWIQTSAQCRRKILDGGFINSGGSINHISSHIVRQAIDNDSLAAHVINLRCVYRNRVEAMNEALKNYLNDIGKWTRPNGGYFFWVEFDESVNASVLRKKSRDFEIGFQSGEVFSNKQQFGNCIRLSFAHYNESDIREGLYRIRSLFDRHTV